MESMYYKEIFQNMCWYYCNKNRPVTKFETNFTFTFNPYIEYIKIQHK
jgi:hypothetical protein